MKLKQYLADKAQTEFEVVRVDHKVAETTGEKIAVLWLAKPIPIVQGTQTITDDATNESARIEAYEVESVRIYERDFDAEGIDINEDGTGQVKTDLMLDVSSAGDVWLTSKSFAAFGREKRQENRGKRNSGILTKMQERKASATFKGETGGATTEKPEAVAGNGKKEKVK